MGIQLTFDQGLVPVKVWTEDIDPKALQQLLNVSELPVVELGKKALEGYALTNKAGETRPCFFGCRRAGKNRTVTG
ncbi:MAG TPA: hypothetical protein VHP37_22985 [Burkholderiales bacterium]|nr:hypothetical protein [Burkholderiales bacterium]